MKSNEELAEYLSGELEEIPDGLIDLANNEGGSDNITVVVVKIEADEQKDSVIIARKDEIQVKLDTLDSVFLFEKLNFSQLTRILNICDIKNHQAGEIIAREGETCSGLDVIMEGRLTFTGTSENDREFASGDHLAASALLKESTFKNTVTATEPSKVLILERAKFKRLIQRRPWLGLILLERLGKRFCEIIEEADELLRENNIAFNNSRAC
ncbi:cyclic nucleotide-binding domain-containing protein [candidate division CSSED10-310 bacterium]|uniref:Cyclic nucleotide-binding domain-containing protein n=1 Tax=candidate division CSSED10-310 bacterium TaxID=2855610 RepID=A0ABV6Z2Z5_UNCC1